MKMTLSLWVHNSVAERLIMLFLSCLLGFGYVDSTSLQFVTCGSVVKLLNSRHPVRLHSHEVKYGSGSGQQSVTGVDDIDDHNSYWAIMSATEERCKRGEPVKCGSTIRLEHLATKCKLHSHYFDSPLSNNQEVSCFGDSEQSDSGDNWIIQCDTDFWERDDEVRLKHVDTGSFLAVSNHKYGRPIRGQQEVCTYASPSTSTNWMTKEGAFFKPSDPL